jgi:hypothetical protein
MQQLQESKEVEYSVLELALEAQLKHKMHTLAVLLLILHVNTSCTIAW